MLKHFKAAVRSNPVAQFRLEVSSNSFWELGFVVPVLLDPELRDDRRPD